MEFGDIEVNTTFNPSLTAGLRELYRDNEVARRLFDDFAGRRKDRSMTPASRAAYLADASHGEIIALFRELDRLRVGEFKIGRRGSKTRIEWLFSMRSLGEVAKGEANQPEEIDPAQLADRDAPEDESLEADADDTEWIVHPFQLRPDLRVSIKLPTNLTSKEAERLAGFIRQVPFDE